jgi:putative endonuclease
MRSCNETSLAERRSPLHSAFRIPHSALLGRRQRRFGTLSGGCTVTLRYVKSGLRTDPNSWIDQRHRRGLAAEQQAMRYLQSQGWLVAAHRFRVGHTEIDLIARRGQLVAFVEVKARRGTAFGSPLEAVTGPKRRELVKAARAWVDRFGQPADVYRFDCIAIVDNKLEHVADAFRPGWR